uniref:Uncharacterized protein n=1 Tax=Oryza barthii TaxID=65489 RepID=A0A0D3GXR1_9ORYZ
MVQHGCSNLTTGCPSWYPVGTFQVTLQYCLENYLIILKYFAMCMHAASQDDGDAGNPDRSFFHVSAQEPSRLDRCFPLPVPFSSWATASNCSNCHFWGPHSVGCVPKVIPTCGPHSW